MTDISKGRYWEKPWSLVDGCTPCSPGCEHCWSAAMAHRFIRCKEIRNGEPILTDRNGRFGGTVIACPERLSIPLKRRKPTIFSIWNDLFHEAVPDEFRMKVYFAINATPQHTYLILTKRPLVMAEHVNHFGTDCPIENGERIYHGLTVCNQQEADEKIPVFLQVPGRKFLSIEPMLGAVSLAKWMHPATDETANMCYEKGFDAVILGGETGPGARPMHPDWVRSVRDQCHAAGVPFFFKGWGKHVPNLKIRLGEHYERLIRIQPQRFEIVNASRLLDGRTHDELPWVQP